VEREEAVKCLVCYGNNDIRLEDREIPQVEDDEVLVKIAYAGICAYEMRMIQRIPEEGASQPEVLGHEFSGTVAKMGKKVSGYQEGDRVTAHPLGGCGECYFCKRAQENFCTNGFNVLHVSRAGAFAEYTPVKAKQVYELPEGMSLETAALIEPVSIAVHAMDLSNIKAGYTVAVLGGGAVGLGCLQLAQHVGASLTILSDPVDPRLKVAKELGADFVVNPTKENLRDVVMKATDNLGVDTCIEAVGAKVTCQEAVSLTKNCGTVLIVGIAPAEARIELSPREIAVRELTVRGSEWSPYCFIRTIPLMKKLKIAPLITHVFSFSEIEKALEVQRNKEGIKILLRPE